jgi:hypothetical protein
MYQPRGQERIEPEKGNGVIYHEGTKTRSMKRLSGYEQRRRLCPLTYKVRPQGSELIVFPSDLLVTPFQGLCFSLRLVPRALPWAVMFKALRACDAIQKTEPVRFTAGAKMPILGRHECGYKEEPAEAG